MRRGMFRPSPAKHVEGIGRDAADAMVGCVHNELHTACNRAKFSNQQSVAEFRPIEQDIVLFKTGWVHRVVVICVVPHQNVRRLDDIFEETGGPICVRKDRIGVRYGIYNHSPFKLRNHTLSPVSAVATALFFRISRMTYFSFISELRSWFPVHGRVIDTFSP